MIEKKIGKIFAVSGVALAMAGAAMLARAEMKLVDPVYDFGIIREIDGSRTGTAHIVNVGKKDAIIRDVRPSCGCTGADYPKDPIAPGDTAVVSFTYNPAGRPGNFNKTVKVYTEDPDERLVIMLKGRVVGTPQTLSYNYPIECGPLRLSEDKIDLSNVKQGSGRHAFIRMVNQSMDTVRPIWANTDKALSIDVTPKELGPGEIATLGIYFNSRFEDKDEGNVEYVIPVKAEGDTAVVNVVIRSNILAPDQAPGEAAEADRTDTDEED